MSKFLRGPSLVLVVGPQRLRASVASAISSRAFPSPVTSDEVRAAESTDPDPPVTAEPVVDWDAAVARLDDGPVGCVVLDAALDGDVVERAAAITDRDPDLPVVVTAADGDERLASDATRAGAFAYLPRPSDPAATDWDDLLDTVERALRTHDRRYRNATESAMLDAMLAEFETSLYVKDDDARHLKISDVTGAPGPEVAIGKTDWELYSWDEDSKFEALGDDRLVIDEGEAVRKREEQHGPPDDKRWLVTSKYPWRGDDGTVRGLVGLTREVTEYRETIRDLRARNRRLDDFTSFVTHDLRNPLHVATSFLDFARQSDGAAAAEHLDQVDQALDRMERLIADLSQLATDEGAPPAPTGGIELVPLLRVVWDDVAPPEATLVVDVPEETTLYTSRLQLKPLFENLFKNAVEHGSTSPRSQAPEDAVEHGSTNRSDADAPEDAVGHGSASERRTADGAGRRARSGVTVRVGSVGDGFYVADDGPGVPEADREAVFEEGYTTAESGTGTGLAIVSEVADAHDWVVRLTESAEGGARFEFSNVPLVTDADPVADAGVSRTLTAGGDVGNVLNAGESSHDAASDSWTLRAAGDNLWGDTNEFHFRRTEVSGPVRVEARLDSFEAPADHSKAGVMVRDGTGEPDPFGYVGRLGDGQTELLWRTADGDPTRSQQLGAGDREFPWFRLERCGDRVTAFVSADGEDWHAIDQRSVALDGPVAVGLAACSTYIGSYCEATFSDVTVVELDPSEATSVPQS